MVMHGRRRISKTTILQEFSRLVQEYFDGSFIANFENWEDALNYLSRKVQAQKTVLIIAEFPFLAETNPSIKSILQYKIDHDWKERNMFLILSGSSVSFMLNNVMGYKSPLYVVRAVRRRAKEEGAELVEAGEMFM